MKTTIKYILLICFLISKCIISFAQYHPILDNFIAIVSNEKIYLHWTITSGSTCNGMKVFRSTDTLNFTEIEDISGICGSTTTPVSYNYSDYAPIPNKTNYYRLELGVLGPSKYVSAEFIKPQNDNYLIRPNPVTESATLFFKNDLHDPYTFTLFNVSGNVVYAKDNIDSDSFSFNRAGIVNGIYFFTLGKNYNNQIRGKIIVK